MSEPGLTLMAVILAATGLACTVAVRLEFRRILDEMVRANRTGWRAMSSPTLDDDAKERVTRAEGAAMIAASSGLGWRLLLVGVVLVTPVSVVAMVLGMPADAVVGTMLSPPGIAAMIVGVLVWAGARRLV